MTIPSPPVNPMNILNYIKHLPPIPFSAGMYDVFSIFRHNKEATFFPVVNDQGAVMGVVREYDLKDYTYGMFGRELIKRETITRFITHSLIVEINTPLEEVLRLSASNENPDGIVVTNNGSYDGIVLNTGLLWLFEENRKLTRARLLQAQKMESIGTMAGGIAHDFNNILMPIMGYAELLQKFTKKKDTTQISYINQIITAAERARDLVAQILKFSRHGSEEKTQVSLAAMISEVLELVRSSIPKTIEIRVSIETKNHTVCANTTEIHQVLMNLCSNASHAMRERGGILQIILADHTGALLGWSEDTELPGPSCVRLTIRDTGHGIKSEILRRIFDPFFTTKKQGEGTGMGLSVVHGIIKGCKGVISVESEEGAGTAFHIYLPAIAPAENTETVVCDETFHLFTKNIHILFVDDEPMISSMAEEMMSFLGLSISSVTDSRAALDIFTANPMRFDIVITDQTMPGLTGLELSRKLLEQRPDLPIILCTGYSETVSAEMAKTMGIAEYLAKPVDFDKLKGIIVRLVNRERQPDLIV
jgi:two-component system, cell cycle sensor histidine kinase and response regulator CckA